MTLREIDFLGIRLVSVTVKEFIDFVLNSAKQKKKTFITYVNAHCVNTAFRDQEYHNILRQADIVYADGQAIVWAGKFLGTPLPERINAGDFFLNFARRCVNEEIKIFLLGSYPEVAEAITRKLHQQIPGLKIVGTQHGFFNPDEDADFIARINSSGAEILFVGMGVPRQEKWAYKYFNALSVPVIWCVGALFEYYAGYRARAPWWLRRLGLEWLFRLLLEPRRLWRRYLLGNPEFLLRVLFAKVKKLSYYAYI